MACRNESDIQPAKSPSRLIEPRCGKTDLVEQSDSDHIGDPHRYQATRHECEAELQESGGFLPTREAVMEGT